VELPGATYLYTLAVVSITFVGFSALVIVFRQTQGGALTAYDTYFTLSFIQIGFIVTAGALLPQLFSLYGWWEETAWRTSSVLVAIPILWFVARVPGRRRAATGRPVPAFVWTLLAIEALSAVVFLLTAARVWRPGPGVYASSLTTVLIASGIAYLLALGIVLPHVKKGQD
jgi:hypothetical protein